MAITHRVDTTKCIRSTHLLVISSALIILFCWYGAIPAFGEPLIVFESNRTGNHQIYLLDLATGEERKLTNSGDNVEPSWSPDGRKIVFTSYRDGNREIYVMDRNGKNQRNLTNHSAVDWQPCWSPDGSQIAFASWRDGQFGEIYVMNTDGTNPRNLTNHPSSDTQPSWSPDGRRIAFTSWRNNISSDIYIMNVDGTNVRNLTNHPSEDRYPAWSPDGRKIVFRSYRCCGQWPSLFVQEIESGEVKRLPIPLDLHLPENPSWTPDSKKILFNNNHPDSQLYLVHIETGKTETLMRQLMPEFNGHPSWFDSKFFSIIVNGKLPSIWGSIKAQSLLTGK